MMEWVANLEKARSESNRFVEVVHVDGRRFYGELIKVDSTLNGQQLVLLGTDGKDIRMYFPTVRQLFL